MHLLHRTDTETRTPAARGTQTPARTRAVGVGAAALAALAVWVIAVPLAGIDLQVAPGTDQPQPVGAAHVVVSAAVAGFAGWGALALLERLTSRARTLWTLLAGAALILSLMGPLAGVTTTATMTLAAMHLTTAAVLIPLLARSATPAGGPR